MRYYKNIIYIFLILIVVLCLNGIAHASINNSNVFTGFFHQKGKPVLSNIDKSFETAFLRYIKSAKPYFVIAYSHLKTPPYFNFNKKINIIRIKKLGLLYNSNYIITGSIARFGSQYRLHAMIVNLNNIYHSKTLRYIGTGEKSLNKNIGLLAYKVSSLIAKNYSKKPLSTLSSPAKFSKKIYAIRVEGNIRVGTGFILNDILLNKGSIYSIKKVNESIKKLYKTGYFKNITVNVKSSPYGLVLTFIVSERPYIKYVKYSGNGSVSVKKIKKIINIQPDTPYSTYKKFKALKILKFLYSAEGYYNAKIKLNKIKLSGNYVGLNFIINQNSPVMVSKVILRGNTSYSSAKLLGVMNIKTVNMLTWITGAGKFKKAKLNSQIMKLLSFYYNNGYINVSVKKPKFIFLKNKKFVKILLTIHQGPQYRISDVNVIIKNKNKHIKEYNSIVKLLKTKAGNIFNRKMIEKDILKITKYLTYKGYAFANVEPSIKISRKNKSVFVKLTIHRGKIARFGKITITGNDVTYSYVILRALVIYPGEKYNPELIKISRRNLKNLSYFKHAAIVTEKVPGKGILNVKIHVKEKNTGKFTVGGGYSSATKLMAISSISESNLFGTGISASLNAQVGGPYQSYSLNIMQPYLMYLYGRPISLDVSLYDTFNSLYYEFAYRSAGGSATVGFPLYKNILTEYVRYLIEQDSSVIIPGLANILPQGKLLTSEISFTTVYNTLNNPMVPTAGDMASFRASFAGSPIGGNDDFVKFTAQENHYIPLWWGTSFMASAQAGYIDSTNSNVPLPIYQRFFVGGITSNYPLLGFMYDSVGPTENGLLYGGTRMMTVGAKYLIPILKKMGFYGFLWWNAGNAWTTSQKINPLNLDEAAGIGFNWYSPFGPIEITYGKILGTPINGNAATRIQFSMGEGFGGL
ncbi:MAG: outer membrane protein assembly factor BamA [bacterium]